MQSSKFKILCVDDDPQILRTYQRVLKKTTGATDPLNLEDLASDLFEEKKKLPIHHQDITFEIETAQQGEEAIQRQFLGHR